jgi:hypothetical protein
VITVVCVFLALGAFLLALGSGSGRGNLPLWPAVVLLAFAVFLHVLVHSGAG